MKKYVLFFVMLLSVQMAVAQGMSDQQVMNFIDSEAKAGTSQAQHHNIAIVQHTHESSGLYIKAGTATAQCIHHAIPSKQDTSGTSGLGVSVATCAFQRQTHSVNIRQSTSGRAGHGLSVGGAVACGIFISVRR